MTFPWLSSSVPSRVRTTFADKGRQSGEEEIRNRAAVLMRLGHSKKTVVARLRAGLAWEWEMQGTAPALRDLERYVNEVFDRAGTQSR